MRREGRMPAAAQTRPCHLDRLFQTRSTTYIPVGVPPFRRARAGCSANRPWFKISGLRHSQAIRFRGGMSVCRIATLTQAEFA